MWKEIRKNYRRLVAFMLAMAMVFTNVGGNLGTVFAAGETEEALFLVDGAEIRAAIRDAKEAGEVFRFSSLELKARAVSVKNKYEKLLGAKEGKVYQLDVDVDRRHAPEYTSLEVYYNSGTEDVVFLCINESDLVVAFRVQVGGYETEPVVVKPNGANVEDEEENMSYTENYEAGDMVNDVKKDVKAEIVATPELSEGETSDEDFEEEPTGEVSESTSEEAGQPETEAGQEEETAGAGEEEAASREEETVQEPEAGQEPESDEEPEEGQALETEAEVSEPAASEAEDNQISQAEQVGLSHHKAAIVAMSADSLETGNVESDREIPYGEPEVGQGNEPETGEPESEETEYDEPETDEAVSEGTSADETLAGEIAPEESREEETEGSKEPEGDEVGKESEGSKPEESESQGEAESSNAPAAEEEDTGNAGENKGDEPEESVSGGAGTGGQEPEEEDGQLLEDDSVGTLGVLRAKAYETVTIRDHVNAKALQVALEEIDVISKGAVSGEIQEVLDAIRALIDNYQKGVYGTEEELGEAIDAVTAMLEGLGDEPYPDELTEAINELQEILGLGVKTLEAEGECTCEYLCTWVKGPFGEYINVNQDCPVCSHATKQELDSFTYDPDHPENFVCKGKQAVIPGNDPGCKHNGSGINRWFPGGGNPDPIPASCQYPATPEKDGLDAAIECWGCGAKWLWRFDPESQADPDAHICNEDDSDIIKEATCTEDGLKSQTCVFCGKIETVIKGGHRKPEDETKIEVTPAGCKNGAVRYICEDCKEEVSETLPGKHGKFTEGICDECGAAAYRIFTYEDGATPSGSGYELKLCARVIVDKDGEAYEEDTRGNRWNDGSFAVIINEALMGKVKAEKDENGKIVMTHVVGYSNGETYQVGDRIPYEKVLDMQVDFSASGDEGKVIYLEAVREAVTDNFEINKVAYKAAYSEPEPELRKEISETSHGIMKEIEYENDGRTCTITYIIPEKYEGDTVDVDATRDVMEAYAAIEDRRFGHNGTQPGDTLGPVFIKVVNNSGKKFSYVEDSFVLQSPGYEGRTPYIGDIRTFDGVIPPEASVPSRVSNGALRHLYGVETDLMHGDLQDDVLDGKLKEKGYENGVADLHQYYLDYYNNFFGQKYNTTWDNLNKVPYELLVQRGEGIFGGHSSASGPKETNPEVAGVGYSYMYTRLMCVVPGKEEGLKDKKGIYAVGNYMKGKVSYEEEAKAAWGSLEPGKDGGLEGMSLFYDGEGNDFYQNTEWKIEVGFRLKEVSTPPEEPKDPDDPQTPPTTPPGGGGSSGGGGGGGRTPRTTTTIDTPEVPLADLPAEPVTELIEELEVPLTALPKTGDSRHSGMLMMMFGMAGIGMILSAAGLRKRKEESD